MENKIILEEIGDINQSEWGYKLTWTTCPFEPYYEIKATEIEDQIPVKMLLIKASYHEGHHDDDEFERYRPRFTLDRQETDKIMHDRAIEIYERNKNPFEIELGRQAYDKDIPLEDMTHWAQKPTAVTSI